MSDLPASVSCSMYKSQISVKIFSFQGLTFDTGISRTEPLEALDGNLGAQIIEYSNFLAFLKTLQRYNLLDQGINQGKVVLADDQYVIRQQVSMSFDELGISNRLLTFSDGQKTIDMFTQIIGDLD